MERRAFLRTTAVAAVASTMLPRVASAREAGGADPQPATADPWGVYDLTGREPDGSGLVLPDGFSARVVATSTETVGDTGYEWPIFPDGGAVFPTDDGGWIYVCNSEVPERGGVSAIRFGADGAISDAYAILTGTSMNCAGGATPWGTWLSCEEYDYLLEGGEAGLVWECWPDGSREAVAHHAMGAFQHEAAVVDHDRQTIYMTEDRPDGRFYRFTPVAYPDLSAGVLEVAIVDDGGHVVWAPITDPSGKTGVVREQVPESTIFLGGEGMVVAHDMVFFTTKIDNRVWRYDPVEERVDVIYDLAEDQGQLAGVDNITATPAGDLLVAEDGGAMELVLLDQTGRTLPIARMLDEDHSELAGPAFDPSGQRLYFSSQRGGPFGVGATFEISGPFNQPADDTDDTDHTDDTDEPEEPELALADTGEDAVIDRTDAGTDSDDGQRWLLPALGGAGALLVGAVAAWRIRTRGLDPEAGEVGFPTEHRPEDGPDIEDGRPDGDIRS